MTVTALHVTLEAIDANLALARENQPGRAVLLPVKANAYGHGIVEVARHVEHSGSADWLGVAQVSEGEQLRVAGVGLPILKLSPTLPEELGAAVAAGLTLTVASMAELAPLTEAARRSGTPAQVHLKVDTGMRRVGAEPDATPSLAEAIAADPHLVLDGLFTHLPIADSPAGEEFTRAQLRRFLGVAASVQQAVGEVPWIHAGNSGGVLGHDLTGTNLIRPGIMAYGCRADATTAWQGLTPAARWTSRLTFLKPVSAGETVGYGRTWTAPRDTWIGTVPVGYGDGYSRLLSNRGRMLAGGRSCPIAGRVCMDQTMIDLGPEPPQVQVGDEVVLLGAQGDERITVEEIADLMGTITYETMCLITARVPRRYSTASA
ncbi:MAG: alanine racemase [Propionibacteriaceae bacterium]|nr:alanine racemase [Propionibacteriaceae bacterium]